ncbi:MAG TPA: thioesterase domain-containing protein [Candidatus Angelobacter sp.]|nr:thioesterase domain-containing protein [Candidatus Angelobacter sp.]
MSILHQRFPASTQQRGGRGEPTWFEHLSPSSQPALRVFCLPYAGGSADVYRPWQRWFSTEVDLCLVHLPGRAKRIGERPFCRMDALVNAIADRIEPELRVPYALYGHSMGGLVAFELARELSRRRLSAPRSLIVSGSRPPHVPNIGPPIAGLPDEQFIAELRRLKGTQPEILDNPQLMEIFNSVLRADFELLETYPYVAGEPLQCPISVYCGLQDEKITPECSQGWQSHTSGAFTLRRFEGDHFFIRTSEPSLRDAFRKDVLDCTPVGG